MDAEGAIWFSRRGVVAPPKPTTYSPAIEHAYAGTIAGHFTAPPLGIILHGSRSGAASITLANEYLGTARYAASGIDLGWNATLGDSVVALHMPLKNWGWSARGCSPLYLAVEFAQAVEAWLITDGQVRAFCWFYRQARLVWPNLPRNFPTHAELDGSRAYGPTDGKTDVYSRGSSRTEALRARIDAALEAN